MKRGYIFGILVALAVAGCTSLRPTETGVQRRHGLAYLNFWGPPYITLPVPLQIEIEPKKGPDFDVYLFSRNMADTNLPPPATMGLYIGHHPDSFLTTQSVTEVSFDLLGSNRFWRCVSEETPQGRFFFRESHLREVFAPLSEGYSRGGLVVHVWIAGTDTNEMAMYEAMVKSLRVKK